MLETYLPSDHKVGDTVYSTGFHESITDAWISPGTPGVVVQESPPRVKFNDTNRDVAVMRSDISASAREAMRVFGTRRTNMRWVP